LDRALGGREAREDVSHDGPASLLRGRRSDLFHLHEVDDLLDHAAERGRVRHRHLVTEAAKPQTTSHDPELLGLTDEAPDQSDLQLGAHHAPPFWAWGTGMPMIVPGALAFSAPPPAGAIEARVRFAVPSCCFDW